MSRWPSAIVRFVVLVVAASCFLAACDGGPDSFTQPSTLVSALNEGGVECSDLDKAEPGDLASEHGVCTADGERVHIYIFENGADKERWLNLGEGLGEVVVGPNWTISAGSSARDISEVLDGRIQ